jgi:ABC-2 type transport system ATP-binding protein
MISSDAAATATPAVEGPPPAVSTQGLTKVYGSVRAVDELWLDVPAGSIYGLIGPNGAGKTTTFQILATLLKPTSGRVSVCGCSSVDEPYQVRKVLGYMPDFFGFYDEIRVGEYLEFFASAYRLAPAQRKRLVPDLLELVDLTHKADEFVESLSRGMKQRLGLARALVHDPAVLILDEPASGLDPRARVEFRELVLELQRMGKTVVISSHILAELEEVCTHIAVLEAGRLLVKGTPSEIRSEMSKARSFRLRLADPAAESRALEVLIANEQVSGAECAGGACSFALAADDAGAAGLLSALVAAGVPIAEFREEGADLEDMFLKITKGVVG